MHRAYVEAVHRANIEPCVEAQHRATSLHRALSSYASSHRCHTSNVTQSSVQVCIRTSVDNSQLSRHNIPLPPSPVSSLSCKAVSSLSCSLSVAPSQLHPVDVAQPEHNQYTLCGHLRTSRAGSHCHCAQRCCAGTALVHRSSVGSPLQRRRPCSATGAQSATDHSAHGTRLVP